MEHINVQESEATIEVAVLQISAVNINSILKVVTESQKPESLTKETIQGYLKFAVYPSGTD